ncbi:MAG: cytochrome c oxidase assembly protein [Pseudomonadota bacterium]
MTDAVQQTQEGQANGNRRIVIMCLSMVAVMGGLAYASVPLYDLFCRVTGYGGTTQRAENSLGVPVIDREVTVRFDANTASSLHWNFAPAQRQVTVKMGEQVVINYIAENLSDEPIVGMASFNVSPQSAGAYFNKIECFCFTDTYIEPGGTLEMPVVFYVDPDMDTADEVKALNTITLSYTFFESDTTPEEITAEQAAVELNQDNNGNL